MTCLDPTAYSALFTIEDEALCAVAVFTTDASIATYASSPTWGSHGGLLSVDEACDRYGLSLEEFASWQRAVDRSGMPGLRVTRIQHSKSLYERQQRY